MKTLDTLDVGEKMVVKTLEKNNKVTRRLLDMGITIGTHLEVRGKAPFGDPIEVIVRGYKLTLRKEEAKAVLG